ALTLMVGIITSVFAALVVTRLLIEFAYKKKDTLNVGGVTFLNNKNINFLGYRKYGFIFSLAITFIGIGAVLFGGLNYGIEFKGGTVIEYNFDKNVNIEDVRASLTKVGYGNAEIQTFGDLKNIVIKIDTPEKLEETTQLLKNTLSESFQQQNNPNLESRIETVGPKIGKELKGDAYKSILWALFVILIYMGVRFRSVRFGVAAIAALFHDILVALGVFGMSGMEVSLSVLAAFLTIVGYSLNDTIIVFDRIREDSELHKKRSLIDLMNGSINATLGRTIMTSSTTLLSVLALFLFGGEVIHGFAAALLVGIFTGTYSTIYVASPILILWENYKAKK
ncbi:protein translocase subunit SecF, partial [bacterium]|nr:protein translocase subunit SecF [bacterium]